MKLQLFAFLFLLVAYFGVNSHHRRRMHIIAKWKDLDFAFPSRREKSEAIESGRYVKGNGVPIDVDIHYAKTYNARVFITIPRFTTGIPFSLATVSNRNGDGGPQISAYPSYKWHSSHGKDCNGITSVFRVAIDECNRLWVLDTGRIDTIQHCAPQLLIFNLENDRLIHRYKFPSTQFIPGQSLFVTPIVDVRDAPPRGLCNNVKVYIADVTGFGILVYDSVLNTSWRVQNNLTMPYLEHDHFTIAGETFELADGILGMSVSPKMSNNRHLYFHALASITENRVPLRVLDNRALWINNPNASPESFSIIGQRPTQSPAEVMDQNGNMFFGLMNPIAIASWNINTPFNSNNIRIVSQDDKRLQFASGVKIVKNYNNQQELWVLTCRFQRVMTGSINANEINFRIQGCLVDDLLQGSMCSGQEQIETNFIFN